MVSKSFKRCRTLMMMPVMPVHLSGVKGLDKRADNVFYHPPVTFNKESNIVVYFGGDIQNFSEQMEKSSKGYKYARWSLDKVVFTLSASFSTSNIIVVQPSSYDYEIYSRFDNFVPSKTYGVPDYQQKFNGLTHLRMLLDNVAKKIIKLNAGKIKISNPNQKADDPFYWIKNSFNHSKLHLIGFSKGCVVLNQFIHEFHRHLRSKSTIEAKDTNDFIVRISDMYFLDGGHSGRKNTWITSDELLKSLSELDINIHIHVTPYQIRDKMRPWIGDEENKFYTILKKYATSIDRTVHFDDEPSSLDKHFEVLSTFKPVTAS